MTGRERVNQIFSVKKVVKKVLEKKRKLYISYIWILKRHIRNRVDREWLWNT